MPFFMINIGTEACDCHAFEVDAATSGQALALVLVELDAFANERVLHSIHVGPARQTPTSDEEIASWPAEDNFKRICRITPLAIVIKSS
jgi:hypothetical protein